MYLVYKHTSPSGKSYIGLTGDYNQRCSQHRYEHSGSIAFAAAIKKYGWDNFLHEILYDELTLEQANWREQQAINEHGSLYPAGYNLTEGGKVCVRSEATKQRISDTKRAQMTPELRARMSAGQRKAVAARTDAERDVVRKRMHEVALARGPQSEETKQKRAATLTGGRQLNRKALWIATSPDGNEFTLNNVRVFAAEHGLAYTSLSLVATGKRKHHKGWLIKRVYDPP